MGPAMVDAGHLTIAKDLGTQCETDVKQMGAHCQPRLACSTDSLHAQRLENENHHPKAQNVVRHDGTTANTPTTAVHNGRRPTYTKSAEMGILCTRPHDSQRFCSAKSVSSQTQRYIQNRQTQRYSQTEEAKISDTYTKIQDSTL